MEVFSYILANICVPLLCAIFASSGMWTFLDKRNDKHDSSTQLLLGLAHTEMMDLGIRYIERGNITNDEYENLVTYLYRPYLKLGGNGSIKHIMELVDRLPIVSTSMTKGD